MPHEINNKYEVGTNRLIQNGMKIVTRTEDVITEFPFLQYRLLLMKLLEKGLEQTRKVCKTQDYDRIYQQDTEEPISLNEIYKNQKRK